MSRAAARRVGGRGYNGVSMRARLHFGLRPRSVVALAAIAVAAALLSAAPPADKPVASRPASRRAPTRPSTEQLHKLVNDLSSETYRVRRGARDRLADVVELPGVAEALKARLAITEDAQVRATLKSLLTGFDQPIAMVWYRGGLKELTQMAPAPWLFIEAYGSFVYDARSPLVGGKVAAVGDWRQGRLPAETLLALKRQIAASGLAVGPSSNRLPRYVSGQAQMMLYFRAGQSMRIFVEVLDVKHMDSKAPPPNAPIEAKLLATLSRAVGSAPWQTYSGTMGLHIFYNPPAIRGKMSRAAIGKLPDFPVAGINLLDARTRQGGIPLGSKDLKRVRAALAKTDIYKYHKFAACQVVLAPHVEKAVGLYYGR